MHGEAWKGRVMVAGLCETGSAMEREEGRVLIVRQTPVGIPACLLALLRNSEQAIWLSVPSLFPSLNLYFLKETFNITKPENFLKLL